MVISQSPGEESRVVNCLPRDWTVLVVDDPLISKLVGAVLRKQGYTVVASNPTETAARLRRAPLVHHHHLLVTNAPAVFLEFAQTVPLLYLSSAPDPELEAQFRACRVVRKPFDPSELIEAVSTLTADS